MNTVRAGVAFATVLLAGLALRGQNISPEMSAKVDRVFDKWNKPDSPGCALGIYKDGHIAYKHGYGMANLNDDVSITSQTVFHVASMSKQFTAASILLLAQQGKLSLDDDVHKYIPELPDFGERITLRHLMHHTSGLRDQWSLLGLAGWRYSKDLITDDDVMSVLVHQKALNFKPGEKYMYSNTGFTLLALVVKKVSGMSLREFTTKNIFEPLGMKETTFRPGKALAERAAPTEQREGRWMRGEVHDPRAYLLGGVAGHAGLFSTAEDLAVFAQMILDGGSYAGKRVLKPETVRRMTTPRQVPGGLRALGWDVQTRFSSNRGDGFPVGSFGHTGFTGTSIWIDFDRRVAIVLLSNRVHPTRNNPRWNPVRAQIADLVMTTLFEDVR